MPSPELAIVRAPPEASPRGFAALARVVLVLLPTPWDDFGFKTTHKANLLQDGKMVPLGYVKIGALGASPGATLPWPEGIGTTGCSELPTGFVSAGGSRSYYEAVANLLGREGAERLLRAIRDIALLPEADPRLDDSVVRISLLRFAVANEAHLYARQIRLGATAARDVAFTFDTPSEDGSGWRFTFASEPIHRMHVLIGATSVGKTRLLAELVELLVGTERERDRLKPRPQLSGAVVISANPFDATRWLPSAPARNYRYYGLHRFVSSDPPGHQPELRVDFQAFPRLTRLLLGAYRAYGNMELARIDPLDLTADETKLLKSAYSKTHANGKGYWLRAALLANARYPELPCPLCELGNMTHLDHYLDQASFPEFCVFPPNLVPSCGDCNPNVARVQNGERKVIHCYRDGLDAQGTLSAVLEDKNAGVGEPCFEVRFEAPAGSLLHRHLETLHLDARYKVAAAAEIDSTISHLRSTALILRQLGRTVSVADARTQAHDWANGAEANPRQAHRWRIAVRRAVAVSDEALSHALR